MENERRKARFPVSREFIVGAVVPTTTVAGGLFAWSFGWFVDLRDTDGALAERLGRMEQYVVQHEQDYQRHIASLNANAASIYALAVSVARLEEAILHARPDPFRGAEAKAMEKRLQRQIDELKATN